MGADFDIIEGIDRGVRWFRRKRAKKVPCQRFLNKIASEYHLHGLGFESKDRILRELDRRGRILYDDKGHCYVITTAAV